MSTAVSFFFAITVSGLILAAWRQDLTPVPCVPPRGTPRDRKRVQRTFAVAVILALLLQMIPLNVPPPSKTTASLVSKAPAPFNAAAPYLSHAVAPLDALLPPFSNVPPAFADPTVGITITKSAPASVDQSWAGDTEITYQFTLTNPSAYTITALSLVTDSVPLSTTYEGGNPGPEWKLLSGGPTFELSKTITSTEIYVGSYWVTADKPLPDGTIITNTNYCFSGTVGITPTQFCETAPITTEIRAPDFSLTESWSSASGLVCAGRRLTYTITISNPGRVLTTQPFTITGVITDPLTIYTDTLSPDATSAGNVITWSITGDERFLDPNGTDILTRTFAVSVPASLAEGTYLTNTYTITSPEVAPTQDSWSSSGVTISRVTAAFTSTSPVCLGETMVFIGTGAGATSYEWNFGDGITQTTTSPVVSHNYAGDGTFTVVLTATGTCGTAVTQTTVTVNPLPTVNFTSNSPVCLGQTAVFTWSASGGIAELLWDFGDGSTETNLNNPQSHTYTATGTYTVTLTVTTTAGCSSSYTDTFSVEDTYASFTRAPSGSVCTGATVQFTDTSTTTCCSLVSWEWNFGDGSPVVTDTNPSHVFTNTGTSPLTRTVTLTVTNGLGCTDVTTDTVTVSPVPQASFSRDPAGPACTGQVITFTDTSSGSPASWLWSFGDGITSTQQSPTHTYATTGTFTAWLTATNACGSDVTSDTITVNLSPLASFTSDSPVCFGQTMSFTNTGSVGTYLWSFGDGITSTQQSPTHTYATTGTFTVWLTTTNACGSDVTSNTVTVNSLPTASFTSNSPVIIGETMYFTNTGSTGTYQWNFGDSSPIETGHNVTHTYSAVGDYTVWLTTTWGTGCWDAFSNTVTVTDVTGCEDIYEPDSTYATATTVTVPSLTSHNFDDIFDEDWAVFSGTAGITYTIETRNLVTDVDTTLYLYNWNGVLLDWDLDSGPGLGSLITWPVTATGWYYVRVDRFPWSYSGCDATYDLSITSTISSVPCTTTLVIEPETLTVGNTATMTATVIDCSSSPLAGQVVTFSTTSGLGSGGISPITATTNANGQAVSYISSTLAGTKLVTATAPNLVAGTDTVTFTAGPPFTITLEAIPDTLPVSNTAILSATVVDQYANPVPGQVITFSTSSDLGSGSISPPTGTTDSNGHVTSNISSTISGTKLVVATAPNLVTGTTTVTFTAPSGCEDAYEPDDSRAEATTVTPPSTTRHNFDDEGDVDWVGFQGTAGITYTIETLNLTTDVDTKLNFYSWNGITLTLLASDDDGGPGFASLITWVMTADGQYYVEVGRFTGSYSGCNAYYDLHITGPPAYVYLPIILKEYPPPPPTPTPSPPTPTPGPCYPLVETSITVGNDPRGVAIGNGMIYVANYDSDSVWVIRQSDYGLETTISPVNGANGVAYDGIHNLVYVTMRDSAQLAVIDASTNTVSETVGVGNGPNGVAYNPVANKIYVANYISDTVTILDGDTRTLITNVTAPGETEPAHIAVNPVTNKVYVTYHGTGKVGVIDGDNNGISIIDIYSAGPYGVTVDTLRNLIYVATIDTHRIVAIGEKGGVPDTYLGWAEFHKDQDPNQPAPMRVIAVNPNLGSSGHLYATTDANDGGFNRLFAIPKGWPEGFHRPYALNVGNNPREGIAVNLSNNRVYVTAHGSDKLTILEDGEPPCMWNFDLGFTVTLCRVGIDGDCR